MELEGFVSGSYESQSRLMSGELCMNLFPEMVPQGKRVRGALVPAPGLPTFATALQSPGRGIFSHKTRLFTVYGSALYESDSSGTLTSRGTLAVDSNPVQFDTNGDAADELICSSGDKLYLLDLSTNTLTNPLTSGSTQCGQLDGFFVSLNASTSTFRISDANDGTTWSSTQSAQRSAAPDPWVAMLVARGEIHLFGSKTMEVWYNAGTSPFPFAARPEGVIQAGCAAAFTPARFANSVAWLGSDEHGSLKVYLLDGYTPIPISTTALEWQITQYAEGAGIADAIGWSYDREGHEFYVLDFPSQGKTHVYDSLTQKWHDRGKWDTESATFTRYRGIFHTHCFNKNIVCDPDGFRLYNLSSSVYTDVGGAELRRLRRAPHVYAENKKLYFPWAELDCDTGVGNSVDPGSDPLVALRYSNDGGATWGGNRVRNLGKIGKTGTRVRWEQCGSGRDRQWEVWSTDPVATRWYAFFFDVRKGRH